MQKVAAFVTRDDPDPRRLLVFRHGASGVQVPAGTVDPDEDPRDAVRRELAEETGLKLKARPRRVAVIQERLREGRFCLVRTTELRQTPGGRPSGYWVKRGLFANAQERRGDAVFVSSQAVSSDADGLSRVDSLPLHPIEGWLPISCLASEVTRHLFHMEAEPGLAERWNHVADHEAIFELYWVPLEPAPVLHRAVQMWFNRARPLLGGD